MGAAGLPALVRGWGQDWGTSFIRPRALHVHRALRAHRPGGAQVSRLQFGVSSPIPDVSHVSGERPRGAGRTLQPREEQAGPDLLRGWEVGPG